MEEVKEPFKEPLWIYKYHCMQLDDFTGKKFQGQNNSILMIWNRQTLIYLTNLFNLGAELI